MHIQFGQRYVVHSETEFKELAAKLKQRRRPWIDTDFTVEDWRKKYPRTILTNEGAPLKDAFWSLVMAGPEHEKDGVYSKRAREMREIFETLPVRQLNSLARAIVLQARTATDILRKKLRGDYYC